MSEDNNYNEILEQVQNKLDKIDSANGIDLTGIKNSVESIQNLLNDSQAKSNFEEIKNKLENIANQVNSCNESLVKDLFDNINSLKEKSKDIGSYLENIKNSQNLSLTSAEFEEFQKQQLDFSVKTNEYFRNEINTLKEQSKNISNVNNLDNLENQISLIHKNLSVYIKQIVGRLDNAPDIEQISSIVSDVSTVNQKNIAQTNTLLKSIEERVSYLTNNEFTQQISKISDIYDSLNIIHAWIEKVGFLNKSIENVYARLGANINFDEVSEKVDIIYENMAALNNWTMKIDNIDGNMSEVQAKVASLSSCIEDTRIIAETISDIKNRLDASLSEDLDLDDLSNKMDIVYENLTALNEWSQKIDSISDDVNLIHNKIDDNSIELRIDEISENISVITDKIQNSITDSKIDKLSEGISDVSDKVSSINNVFEEELISSKIDLIYENINLLNDWVGKIDGISQKSEELDNKFNRTSNNLNIKIEEITETLSNAAKIIEDIPKLVEDIPDMKGKLEELSDELNIITKKTKNETESYIYTLLDIESDFLKLHQFLDDKSRQTSDDINALRERFDELNDDISSISKRTNKLILSADEANKEFKNHLETFKNTILELDIQRQELNPENRFNTIANKLTNIAGLLQNTINTGNNINTAFMYLAEWIDTTDNTLNQIQNSIVDLAEKSLNKNLQTEISKEFSFIKKEISNIIDKVSVLDEIFSNYKNEDFSELKSLITGVIVQLNTALKPDIDSINDKIDKVNEDNNTNFAKIESALKEKINAQAKHIIALEEKIDNLNSKFDKLIETLSEDNSNFEIKDILNYITSQISHTNEELNKKQVPADILNDISEKLETYNNKQKAAATIINKVADKLESFDNNINKIVSYIEED